MKSDKKSKKTPFFARFLESQEKLEEKYPKVKANVRAGKWDVTMKYPSDGDDWPTA